jgi:CMP-N,N'-diacetyllegionaminic acid synthase
MYKTIAIIPARGGSKRLPKKNILELAGKPAIAWTIEAALQAENIDKVIVSTDSHEIAEVAKQYNADVPFIRPDYLAEDTSTSYDVIIHALDFVKAENYTHFVLLQPTSPLRTSMHIDKAFDMIKDHSSIMSVCEVEHSPLWSNTLPEDLSMKEFISPKIKNVRSQDLPIYYRINGAIYIAEINYFKENKGFMGNDTHAYIMPQDKSIDIDTIIDFKFCNLLLNENY